MSRKTKLLYVGSALLLCVTIIAGTYGTTMALQEKPVMASSPVANIALVGGFVLAALASRSKNSGTHSTSNGE